MCIKKLFAFLKNDKIKIGKDIFQIAKITFFIPVDIAIRQ
jgi:hypothetical protein